MIEMVLWVAVIAFWVIYIIISAKSNKLNKQLHKIETENRDKQHKMNELLIEQNNYLKKIINDAVDEVRTDD